MLSQPVGQKRSTDAGLPLQSVVRAAIVVIVKPHDVVFFQVVMAFCTRLLTTKEGHLCGKHLRASGFRNLPVLAKDTRVDA